MRIILWPKYKVPDAVIGSIEQDCSAAQTDAAADGAEAAALDWSKMSCAAPFSPISVLIFSLNTTERRIAPGHHC